MSPMATDQESYHLRLVTLGATNTGKKFLFNTFNEKHRPTIEDLFTKDFSFGTVYLKVDFLDTEGSMQFPAMRRLSIANANAFLLVYSIDSEISFDIIKQCFEEIKEIRSDFQEVPIVFVGNKQDLDSEHKRCVQKEDVAEWIFCELPKLRAKLMECSAKNSQNIKEIFITLQQLARIPMPDAEGLKRRSSAQARVDSKRKFAGTNLLSPSHANNDNNHMNTKCNSMNTTPNPTAPNTPCRTINSTIASSSSSSSIRPPSSKPRSRSLIRRTSKKVKNKEDADDCTVQ
ncbi:hypothetical protein DERP_000924 [Dermatophagoides pteronyssinus]|uniref:GTP-binding protein Di-Ras2-like n=1 Tax=Dermatophagoides pteronyssinus TaxID=6956 RepID=A0ABQ8JDH4_DERPT|nr:hypothetical protein DERP_000924 [Dermatophagoides pteronyssinus]